MEPDVSSSSEECEDFYEDCKHSFDINVCHPEEGYYHISMRYSPSGRYAIMAFNGDSCSRILVIDLLARRLVHSIDKRSRLEYWYWLDEYKISLVFTDRRSKKLTQCVYQCNFSNPDVGSLLVKDMVINFGDEMMCPFSAKDASKLTVKGNDFLLIKKSRNFDLLPYNLDGNQTYHSLLKIEISAKLEELINGEFRTSSSNVFTYKNKLYFWLWSGPNGRCTLDSFLQVEVTTVDFKKRTVAYKLDPENAEMLCPRKLNDGQYMVSQDADAHLTVIQSGPLVTLFERKNINCDYQYCWILDLDEETIFVQRISIGQIGRPSMYRNMFLFHEQTAESIEFKFKRLDCLLPSLKDLCHVTLLSQKTVNPLYTKNYDKLSRF